MSFLNSVITSSVTCIGEFDEFDECGMASPNAAGILDILLVPGMPYTPIARDDGGDHPIAERIGGVLAAVGAAASKMALLLFTNMSRNLSCVNEPSEAAT